MAKDQFVKIKSVSEIYKMLFSDSPNHPLIGIVDMAGVDWESMSQSEAFKDVKLTSDLYTIILKDGDCGMMYGRNKYDFNEGVLRFIAPNQVISGDGPHTNSTYGFMLIFHPDLIRNFDLGKQIKKYNFFSYDVYEALHLSKKEETTLMNIVENIKLELQSHIDKHSQEVIVTNIQLLLNYSKRFYERQFITRTNSNSDVVAKVEALIQDYYTKGLQIDNGTPSPDYFAEKVNFSTNYLSDLLRKETGRSTKDHIDDYIIDLAKNSLLSSSESISEIAYNLGFNYPHYFSRLFKKKTGETPVDYRAAMHN
jgi:AraC-like DNA-binding protein